MNEKSNSFLETEKISTLMRKYSIPCIISLLVAALYNIVDQIFIANASYLGSYGNSANTVVYPLTVAALSIAVMIGDGTCAFVSIALGAGHKDQAHRSIGNAIILSIVSSIVIMILYLTFQDPIITAFGGSVAARTWKYAHQYFFWITLGIPVYMFGQAMNPIIRSDGSPRFAMASTLAGCFANIILDPIFIFPMHMGMAGAAIATVIGQIITAVMSVWYLFHMKAVSLEKSSFLIDWKVVGRSLSLGITSFLSQISIVASMMVMQNMVMKYGAVDPIFGQAQYAAIPMAVLGIVMKFFQIVISISVGISAGCIPVAGYNVGAGRNDRARDLFVLILKWQFVVGFVSFLIVEIFPHQLIDLFGAANESAYYTTFAVKSFRTYLALLPVATINKGTFIYLQALGKAKESTVLSLIREIVFGCGFALLLPVFFGLNGVLYSMPCAEGLTFVIAVILIAKTMRQLSVNTSYAVK